MTTMKYALVILAVLQAGLCADPCAPDCVTAGEEYFPHPKDCSKYYQCVGFEAVLQSCPAGLEWSPTYDTCDYPESAGCTANPDYDCGGETTTKPTEPTTTTNASATTVTSEKTTTVSVESTSSSGTCVPDCPSPTARYADPRDCHWFFNCIDNIPHHTECPEQQEYWTKMELCDDPEFAQCTSSPDAPCVAVTIPHTTLKPTTFDPFCEPPCPSPNATFGVPRNCTGYFACVNDERYYVECPEELPEYWAEMEKCDIPENAQCTANSDSPCVAVTVPQGTLDPTTQTPTTKDPNLTTDPTEECVPPCPSPEAIYPDPRNCSRFFKCANSVPFITDCPPAQEYWLEMERCDWPESAMCTASPDDPCVAITNPPQHDVGQHSPLHYDISRTAHVNGKDE